LNNAVVASPRALIAVLENYVEADSSEGLGIWDWGLVGNYCVAALRTPWYLGRLFSRLWIF